MHPVLFEIGGLTFYTYGLIMAFGFLCAYVLIYHLAGHGHEDTAFYENLFLWLIVFGIAGAKILHLIVMGPGSLETWGDLAGCLRGGLVWYGGVIANIIFLFFYCRRHQKSYLHVLDIISAPTMLGLGIGRWGCLMAGCCHGKPTSLPFPFSITYPHGPYAPEIAGVPVHPAPVYASINAFIIAGICYLVYTRSKRRGLAVYTLLTLYSATRFLLEFIRGDTDRGWVIPDVLSTSQFIGIIIFFPALYLLIRTLRRPLPEFEPGPEPGSEKNKKKGKS
jgi:phosphatidylglycerol:prolipoprotein diacylglycerol transferase